MTRMASSTATRPLRADSVVSSARSVAAFDPLASDHETAAAIRSVRAGCVATDGITPVPLDVRDWQRVSSWVAQDRSTDAAAWARRSIVAAGRLERAEGRGIEPTVEHVFGVALDDIPAGCVWRDVFAEITGDPMSVDFTSNRSVLEWTLDPDFARFRAFEVLTQTHHMVDLVDADFERLLRDRGTAQRDHRVNVDGDRRLHRAASTALVRTPQALFPPTVLGDQVPLRRIEAFSAGMHRGYGVRQRVVEMIRQGPLAPVASTMAQFVSVESIAPVPHPAHAMAAGGAADGSVQDALAMPIGTMSIKVFDTLHGVPLAMGPLGATDGQLEAAGHGELFQQLVDTIRAHTRGDAKLAEYLFDAALFTQSRNRYGAMRRISVAEGEAVLESGGVPRLTGASAPWREAEMGEGQVALGHDDPTWTRRFLDRLAAGQRRETRDYGGRLPVDVALARPDGARRMRLLVAAGYDVSGFDVKRVETALSAQEAEAQGPRQEGMAYGRDFLARATGLPARVAGRVAALVGERRWLMALRREQGASDARALPAALHRELRDLTGMSDGPTALLMQQFDWAPGERFGQGPYGFQHYAADGSRILDA